MLGGVISSVGLNKKMELQPLDRKKMTWMTGSSVYLAKPSILVLFFFFLFFLWDPFHTAKLATASTV